MAIKKALDMTTQNMLYQLIQHVCFFLSVISFGKTFRLSEEVKDKCIAIIQKQIIMKIFI